MQLKNYIVPSVQSYLTQGHIDSEKLIDAIENWDGSEGYHCFYDLEPSETYKEYKGKHKPAMGWTLIDIDFSHPLKTEAGDIIYFPQTDWEIANKKTRTAKPDLERNITDAKSVVVKIIQDLQLNEKWARIYFSGSKGFHIYIRQEFFGLGEFSVTTSAKISQIVQGLSKKYGFNYDDQVYQSNRKIRIPNSLNPKSGLHKIELEFDEFYMLSPKQILEKSKKLWNVTLRNYETPSITYKDLAPEVRVFEQPTQSFPVPEIITEDSIFQTEPNKSCIKKFMEGGLEIGDRHNAARTIIVDSFDIGLSKEETIEKIIDFCSANQIDDRRKQYLKNIDEKYSGKFEYKSGCYSGVKHKFCSGKCPLYSRLNKERRAVVTDMPEEIKRNENDIFHLDGGTEMRQSVLATELAKSSKGKIIYEETKDRFYVFNKVWTYVNETDVKREVNKAFIRSSREGFSNNLMCSVFSMFKLMVGKGQVEKVEWLVRGIVPFQNGLLNLETKQLEPFDQKKKINFILPYEYDEQATCPTFDELIDFLSMNDPNTKKLLLCFLSAIIRGRNDLEKYLELVGEAGSGKSSYMMVAKLLVGEENTVTSNLRYLGSNRFETAAFYGKRLAVFPDEKDYLAEGTDVFKALTGNDPIRYEKKGIQQSEGFVFTGMVIVSCNSPMSFEDYSNAIPRRRITVHIDSVVPKEKKDVKFKEKLKSEIPGIINQLLQISDKEIESVLLDKNSKLEGSQNRALVETNHVYNWFDQNVVITPNTQSYVGSLSYKGDGSVADNDEKLYPNYVSWCQENGRRGNLNVMKFSSTIETIIRTMNLNAKKGPKTRNGIKWIGLSLRDDLDFMEPCPITKAKIE